jgi:hypothetical protein
LKDVKISPLILKRVWLELLFGEIESDNIDKNCSILSSIFFKTSKEEITKYFKNNFYIALGCNDLHIDS